MGSPEAEEQQIDSISFILVVMIAAILPLIAIPKVVATPINTWYFLDYIGYYKVIFLLIVSIFMVTIMLFKAIARKQRIKFSIPLIMFVLWVLLSLFFARDKVVAFVGYTLRWQGFVAYFCYGVVFTFVVNMLKPKYIGKLLVALFVCASIISVHSLLNYYGIEPLEIPISKLFGYAGVKIDPSVSRGTLGNRNTGGAYFTVFTIVSLVLFLKNQSKKRNILFYFALLISYSGLIVSLTRVSWIGTICAMVFSAWLFRRDIKKYIPKISIVVFSFILVLLVLDITGGGKIAGRYYSLKDQVEQAQNGNVEGFGTNRFYIYRRTFKVIADNPIVGVGPDCFAYVGGISREEYEEHPELSGIGYFDKVHSEYLEFAATMGIPALIFYVWFILSIFVPWLRKKGEMKPEILAVFLGLTGYLMQACFNFGAISVLPVFFVLLGILKSAFINENNEENGNRVKNDEMDCIEITTVDTDDKYSLT